MDGLENSDTADDLKKRTQEIIALNNFSKKINTNRSMDDLFQCAIDEILDIVNPDLVLIFIREGENLILRRKGARSDHANGEKDPMPVHKVGECLCGLSASEVTPQYSKNIHKDPRCTWEECKQSGYASFAAFPIENQDTVCGVLGMASFAERDFSTQRHFLEALASELSIGLKNSILFKKITKHAEDLEARNREFLRAEREQKEAELQLNANQLMLQTVFDGISEPLILLDNDMRIKMLNQAARRYYRIDSATEAKGVTCHRLFKDRSLSCEKCNVPSVINGCHPATHEREGFMNPDRIEKVSVYPIKEANGRDDGCIIHIYDITEEKRMEKELQQADKMISLGILVSGVAHEINNPNNWIMLNTPILQNGWESVLPILDAYHAENGDFIAGGLPYSELREAIPQLLNGILGGAKRIMRIVEDLKDYARYQPSDVRAPIDINKTLAEAVALVANQIKQSTKAFSVTYGDGLPMIQGNWQKIEQVIINLLQNACQALGDDAKGISVKSFWDKQSGMVAISVTDEGSGIPEKILPRIMDPFFTTKRNMGGTGLGLSVSSKIVRDHGGRLRVVSHQGQGSTFTILLPTEQRTRKVDVLVADDEVLVRDLVAKCLAKNDRYAVKEATNGAEACLMLGNEPPDVLILDINMPDMDGLEVCRQIKKTPALRGVKVITITGNQESDKARAIADMGYNIILPKPLSPQELMDTLEAVVREDE